MKAALYARVSTDDQREESLEDQLRECRDLCKRHGFEVAEEFSDYGLSGNESDRPGYQRLLAAVRRKRFGVVVAHELSRLWRNEAELHAVKEELEYLEIEVVTDDGIDTRLAGMDVLIAVKGSMARQELKQIAHRTHRALKGLALDGKSAGGKCYGYVPATLTGTGQRAVDRKQAKWVVWIFERYAEGWSPRRIADDLNRRGVPSPGAGWNRKERRRDGKWLASTIYGSPRSGSGILNNEIYVGRLVWNRSRSKKRLKSGRREFHQRPTAEWVTVDRPALRIVPPDLWERVRARQRERSALVGDKVRAGLSHAAANGHAGAVTRGPKYLLSGLLKCGTCGSNFVVSGTGQQYVCASHTNGGRHACANHLRVPRARVEERLLSSVVDRLLSDEAIDRFKRDVRELLQTQRRETAQQRQERLRQAKRLRSEVDNLADAIATGALRTSAALAERLARAEAALAEAERDLIVDDARLAKVVDLVPKVAERYRRLVADLPNTLAGNVGAARREIGALLGGAVKVARDETTGEPVAYVGLNSNALAAKCLGARAYIRVGSGGRI